MSDEAICQEFKIDIALLQSNRNLFDAAVERGQGKNAAMVWKDDASCQSVYKYNDMLDPLNTSESWAMVTMEAGDPGFFLYSFKEISILTQPY